MRALATRKLLRALRDLGAAVNDAAPRVNYGGCAVIAHLVGASLERMGVACEVTTSLDWEEACSPAEARPHVRNPADPYEWDANGLGRGHLALRFKIGRTVRTWDTDGLYLSGAFGLGEYYTESGPWGTGLTIGECRAMTRRPAGWNRAFNRRLIPTLRRLVREHLEQKDLTVSPRARTIRTSPQLTLGL